jgi:hypothetical protein
MLLGYLLIWMIIFFIFKYDIKQNNIDAILRTTCFTLLSYVILEYGVKEYFKEGNSKHHKVKKSKSATGVTETTTEDGQINTPDTATIEDNPITLQVSKYKKQKKKCDYLQEQKKLTTNSLYQMFDKLTKSPSVTNTDLSLVQNNFNDLFAIKDADTDCVSKS